MTQSEITSRISELRGDAPDAGNLSAVVDYIIKRRLKKDGLLPDLHHNATPALRAIVKHFWDRVEIRNHDECWQWNGGFNGLGQRHRYGVLGAWGIKIKAHQFSYLLFYGEIEDRLFICHHCDNPPCVNPNHLFAGTAKDNTEDCKMKGRLNLERGEKRYCAKMNEEIVRQIKQRYASGERRFVAPLARQLGVYPNAAWNVINGLRWKHVTI